VVVVIIVAALFFFGKVNLQNNSSATATIVSISNCNSISPQDVLLPDGGLISFKNSDSVDHTIYIGGVSLNVPAKGSSQLTAKFEYGTGTYGYACDGNLVSNQIVLVPIPGSAAVINVTFKSVYDGESQQNQSCLKSALGSEFDSAYGNPNYVPSNTAMAAVNACLASTLPPTSTTTSK